MPNKLFYTVLPVGQGSGTLVQVVDATTNALVETSLIDLGSLGWSEQTGKPSADFVIAELKKMNPIHLSALFVSHSDSDHINLLGRVLDAFDKPSASAPTKPVLTIDEVWYGGTYEHYKKRGKNILDRVEEYRSTSSMTNFNTIGSGATSWAHDPPTALHTTPAGVEFWLLYGNAPTQGTIFEDASPSRKASRAYLRNVSSMVLSVRFGTTKARDLMATGDATGLTLLGCINVIHGAQITFAPVLTMSLPHHGSAVTTYDMLGISTEDLSRDGVVQQVIERFIDDLRPRSITASAGEDHHHKHPASRVIHDFGKFLDSRWYRDAGAGFGRHFFTAYIPQNSFALTGSTATTTWPPTTDWYTARTDENVFTVDYFHGDPATVNAPVAFPPDARVSATAPPYAAVPPRAAGWLYEVSATGTDYVLYRVLDRNFTSARTMALLEAVHGGLPQERFVRVPSAPDEPDIDVEDLGPRARVAPAAVPLPGDATTPAPGRPGPRRLRGIA